VQSRERPGGRAVAPDVVACETPIAGGLPLRCEEWMRSMAPLWLVLLTRTTEAGELDRDRER
jgi:hypothetical protein